MSEEDSLDGVLGQVSMGRWQLLGLLINCLIWSVLAPHTIGTTLLNAPVNFKCSSIDDPYFGSATSSATAAAGDSELLTVVLLSEEATNDATTQATDGFTTQPPEAEATDSTTISSDGGETDTPSSLLNDDTTAAPSSKSPSSHTFDSVCFDSPPLHVLPGIFETANNSWIVDDHGALHKLQPGDEFRVRQGLGQPDLVEVVVPSCPTIAYDDSIFTSTVTTEWNLICEHSLHRPLFQNSYTLGIMVGCVVGGDIGDRFGRVAAIRMGAILHLLSSLVVAFTTNFTVLLVARFLVGLTNLAILVPAVTLALETCPASLRGMVGMGVGLPYSVGVMLFGAIGYLVRSWRYLYMATSFPAFLMVPVSFFLDESPRWLLQKGRMPEAKAVLQKAAKMNRSQLPPDHELEAMLLQVAQKEAKPEDKEGRQLSLSERLREATSEVASFVRGPAMRRISIVTPINWVFSEIIYYGIIFNANNFSNSNPFVYVALTGVSDAAAILIGAPISNKIGRRNTVGLAQFLAGLLTIIVLAVPAELRWLQWVLVMGGFLMSAAAAQILYVFTPELYPTTLRTRGFAFCNLTGYAGAFLAPFIPEFLAQYGWWVTDVCLGLAGIIGGVIIFLLPETNNRVLCETVEDVEERAKLKKEKKQDKKKEKKDAKEKALAIGNGTENSLERGWDNEGADGHSTQTLETDGEIIKNIVLSNSSKFVSNPLTRSSSRRASTDLTKVSGSINCLLETTESLSTGSFGTNNVSPYVRPKHDSPPPERAIFAGKDNAAFERQAISIQVTKDEKKLR